MVGEPLLRMGEDLMGVKLPVVKEPPRIGGSGLGGRGCASENVQQYRGYADRTTKAK